MTSKIRSRMKRVRKCVNIDGDNDDLNNLLLTNSWIIHGPRYDLRCDKSRF